MKRLTTQISNNWFGSIILVTFIILIFFKPISRYYDDFTTTQPWFSAAFDVPNFEKGKDPDVAYHLHVNRPVHGLWLTTIYKIEGQNQDFLSCTGGGYTYYNTDVSGTILTPLSRFNSGSCPLSEGQYRMCINYDLKDENNDLRDFGPFCDYFTVTAASR